MPLKTVRIQEMDGSDKNFLSLPPIKPSSTPKHSESDAGPTKENNQTNQQSPKKTTTKNFMSPTISATSKAVVPKKKILTERNEASESIFSDTHLQKTPNFDSKPHLANWGVNNSEESLSHGTPLSSSRVSEFDDNEQNTFVADSSSKPYDPLTNYLSPRPKFLRYKPNRRRGIFFLREGNVGLSVNRGVSSDSTKAIDEETSVGAGSSSASSSQDGSIKEDEEIDEIDADIEELKEEGGWNLNGVLKTLLVFVVLVLSTLYISSMNSPTASPVLQAINDLKDADVNIQNQIFGAASAKSFEGGSEFLDQREEKQTGLVVVNQRDTDEMIEDISTGLVQNTGVLGEAVKLQAGGREMVEVVEDESDHEMEVTREVSDKMGENIDLQEIETVEKFESLQNYQTPFVSDWIDLYDTVSDVVNAPEKEVNGDKNPNDEKEKDWVQIERIFNEVDGEVVENEMEVVEGTSRKTGEVIMSERKENEDTDFEVINHETAINSMEELTEDTETESISKDVIGASIFFAIVASLVLGFHFMCKKIPPKESLSSVKPGSEYMVAEKGSPVLPNEGDDQIGKVDSFMNPLSLIHSREEASKEFYESRAPTVELLGEFVVGEISSSIKSCRMKSKMMDSEESNYSVSQETRTQNKAHLMHSHAETAISEFSTIGSPSYGSFTAEKKIVKNEEGQDGEMSKMVTTPVRRSSRVRNRTVMSP